jgi:hypothetical protein
MARPRIVSNAFSEIGSDGINGTTPAVSQQISQYSTFFVSYSGIFAIPLA